MPKQSYFFKDILPRVGFIWPRTPHIFRRHKDDSAVRVALANKGPFTRRHIVPHLVSIFTKAADRIRAGDVPDLGNERGQYLWLTDLRKEIDFACDSAPSPLQPSIFAGLFYILFMGRKNYLAIPEDKRARDGEQPGPLAIAIDEFWGVAEFVWNPTVVDPEFENLVWATEELSVEDAYEMEID